MLLSSARVSPCMARTWRSSLDRLTTSCPPATETPRPVDKDQSIFPSGPFTDTIDPLTFTSTPAGIWIGFFPMRDIDTSSLYHTAAMANWFTLTVTTLNTTPLRPVRHGAILDPSSPLSRWTESPHPVSYTHLRAHETPEHLVC